MAKLERDGWVVSYHGTTDPGFRYPTGSRWFGDYETACKEFDALVPIYGERNVTMKPHYVINAR